MNTDLHPYVVFLPTEQKNKVLSAIFGSRAAVDILEFSLARGISNKIYQKDLVKELPYSNKTIIGNLKSLTRLGVLAGDMEKADKDGRVVWLKAYQLSDTGRWFALLLAKEKDLSRTEKADILRDLFRAYIKWAKNLSRKVNVSKDVLKNIFEDEMK